VSSDLPAGKERAEEGSGQIDGKTARDREAYDAGFIDSRAKREFYVFGFACFLVSFVYSHSALFAVVFAREGHDLHAIGLLLSLFAIPVIFMSFFSGVIAARLGVLEASRISIVFVLAGFSSLYFTSGAFWPALVSRFLQGIGQGLFLGCAMTYAQSRLSPRRFVYLLGVFSSMLPLAQAFGPPFGAFVLNTYGPRAIFIVGAIPACFGLLLTFGLRPLPRAKSTAGLELGAHLRRDRIGPLAAIFINGTIFGFTGAYLAATLEAKALPIAAFFIASTTAMFASRFLAMRRLSLLDWRILVSAGILLQSLSFILIALAGQSWLIVITGVMFGTGYSVVYPILSARMSEGVAANERAGPQGLLNTVFNLGLFAMPYPETLIIAHLGYSGTLIILAIIGIATAAVLFGLALRDRSTGR
jgi:MFS family permease